MPSVVGGAETRAELLKPRSLAKLKHTQKELKIVVGGSFSFKVGSKAATVRVEVRLKKLMMSCFKSSPALDPASLCFSMLP
ncbi:hypothetical protein AOLI_G00276720 [Acnodon oligacanthus]